MFRLRKPTLYDFTQAIERGLRAGAAAFIAIYPAARLLQDETSHNVDSNLLTKAALAGCVALVAFLWRWLFPDIGRSAPVLSSDPAVDVVAHPHGSDVATDA